MNDRLKFRTWDKEIKKLRYGDVALDCNGKPFVITCDPKKPIEYLDNVEVNFCTGFKDCKGNLVYFNDLVKGEFDEVCLVDEKKCKNEFGRIILRPIQYLKIKYCQDFGYTAETIADSEVIGNIYTNPELLEEQC